MENPLWHDSLTFERLIENRIKHSPTTGVRFSHDEAIAIGKQLELMRRQLPPA
jgi:hypothetical protein